MTSGINKEGRNSWSLAARRSTKTAQVIVSKYVSDGSLNAAGILVIFV